MSQALWYTTFFGQDYLRMYAPALSRTRTAWEVDGVLNLLQLPVGRSILDLGCGQGRHAIMLAQRGYVVTGQDLSFVLLDEAQKDAMAQGSTVRWIQRDMRDIPFEDTFDAVILMFNTFGYLENDQEHIRTLQAIYRTLKPGGKLLIDLHNRDHLLRNWLPYSIDRYDDGLMVLQERQFNLRTGRNEAAITLLHPSRERTEYAQSQRVYTLPELEHMFTDVSLQIKEYYGSLDKSHFTLNSNRLTIIGQK